MGYGSDNAPGLESCIINGETVSKATFETIADQGLMISTLKARVAELEGSRALTARAFKNVEQEGYESQQVVNQLASALGEAHWELDTLKARVAELEELNRMLTGERSRAEDYAMDCREERDQLRAELESSKAVEDAFAKDIIRLTTELEALRPKPVVVTRYVEFGNGSYSFRGYEPDPRTNLKLTFTDGKLTGAEVIK